MKLKILGSNWKAQVGLMLLHSVVFLLTFAGTLATFFMLAAPIILIGLPTAIFAKSKTAKSLAITAVMGCLIWIPIFQIPEWLK